MSASELGARPRRLRDVGLPVATLAVAVSTLLLPWLSEGPGAASTPLELSRLIAADRLPTVPSTVAVVPLVPFICGASLVVAQAFPRLRRVVGGLALLVVAAILVGLLCLAGPNHTAPGGWLLLALAGCAVGFLVRTDGTPAVAGTIKKG